MSSFSTFRVISLSGNAYNSRRWTDDRSEGIHVVDASLTVTMGEDRWTFAEEGELITAACSDMDVFATLYNRYRPRVFAYLLTYAATVEDADDLTQYVFVRVLETLPSYQRRGAPFSAWLFRIARNAAIDAYRRQRRVLPWDHLPEALQARIGEEPEYASLHADDLNRVRVLVAHLHRDKQELLALRFAADLTIAEIAALLGKRESAVQKQLSRTIQHLKGQFHAPQI
jgi:RNA polymerase sigma-70 factor, ECF subfamily